MLTYKTAHRFVELHEGIVALKRLIADLRITIKGNKQFIRQAGGYQLDQAVKYLEEDEKLVASYLKILDKSVTKLNNLKYKA